jgi:hypothetical protein
MSVTFMVIKEQANERKYLSNEDNELNLSNSNFFAVMESLGYTDVDYCGHFVGVELTELRGRVHGALVVIKAVPELDMGVPVTVYSEPGRMTMIDCGRRVGYLQSRLTALATLLDIAVAADGELTYG